MAAGLSDIREPGFLAFALLHFPAAQLLHALLYV